ncbi:hypothetical protein BAE44_0001184, partial [Dichanthelium oligosanthes]
LYNNRDVRFFTYSTRDVNNSPGCYNLQCPGFVPASGAALVPGQAVAPPSVYGEERYYVTISLNKDPNSGDWVVYRHDLETPSYLGHFPGAARPPLLTLLPGCYVSTQYERDKGVRQDPTRSYSPRSLDKKDNAVLRRGEGELLVAQLEVMHDEGPHDKAEVCVLRHGLEWELKRLPIVHHGGGELQQWPEIEAAVAVDNGFMCWVDYVSGIFVCDMQPDSSSKVLYVPLPVPPPDSARRCRSDDRPHLPDCHNLAAAGPDAVRLVSVAPCCCCGGPGKTSCERSRFAFNVTTWTLTLRIEGPMTWVKNGVLDCNELWQLPNYVNLPRVAPEYPIVLCENHYDIDGADKTVKVFENEREAIAAPIKADLATNKAAWDKQTKVPEFEASKAVAIRKAELMEVKCKKALRLTEKLKAEQLSMATVQYDTQVKKA